MNDTYWKNAIDNASASWLKPNVQIQNTVYQRLDPKALTHAAAVTLSLVASNNYTHFLSVYLENTTGTGLDYEGKVRSVIRYFVNGVPEGDDSYRERIRRFWSPPNNSVLEKALNAEFSEYGVFSVVEIPYTFNALNNKNVGAYVGRNSYLLPTSTDPTDPVGLFPTSSRTYNNAIMIYLEVAPDAPDPTSDIPLIRDIIKKLKAYGVVAFLTAFNRNP